MTPRITRRQSLLGILLMSTGMLRLVINPSFSLSGRPTEGDPLDVTVGDMPTPGTWSVTISYSTGDQDPTVVVVDSDTDTTTTTPPPGSSGGTMTVEVVMGNDRVTRTYDVN